ncbi:serine protease [Draconibacterium sp. IB214405]|uniref:S1C family serine protease n=1 Tax=Draconibacterium sp. IB214405 TaxID=3097352 RepID=UPI002A1548D8|nr:serine protease [Draconibacterium sp. IB214405]MDX8341681.1 serine protease [Draconibacterium sp. IB214405]
MTYSETLNDYEGIYYDKNVNKKELEILARRTKIHFEKESIKLFPTKDMIIESRQRKLKTSASGFAITTNGIIVTNYHVVENAESIKVKGINSNFDKSYNAKVVVFDKNNDIALLKLTESETMKLSIPFTLRTELAKVGESIYALGYPLRASMGDEIKLTNGIISSKTGFQGDATTYQVSAPVQPGNSGGPLFDNKGCLVGIVSSKHAEAENVTYAIKTNYLVSLLELLPNKPNLQKTNLLEGKELSDKIEQISKFVYIIEIN